MLAHEMADVGVRSFRCDLPVGNPQHSCLALATVVCVPCCSDETGCTKMRFAMKWAPALAVVMCSAPALAEVHDSAPGGFAVRATATVPAGAEEVWNELLDPADWWDGAHTFSSDAANLSLDPRAGGCFCELLPNAEDTTKEPRGGVQHMQVVYIEKAKVLRMTGALGPLQSEPVNGVLTFVLKPDLAGTRINAEYSVGGYMRIPTEKIAPMVDRVFGQQVARLAAKLGGPPAGGDDATTDTSEAPAGDAPAPDAPSGEAKPTVEPEPVPDADAEVSRPAIIGR